MDYTPGSGGGSIVPVVAGGTAAVLPVTGAEWAIPAAAAALAVLIFWGMLYAVRNRTR